VLKANDRPVAVQYLLTQNGRWYSYQGGFDPGYTRFAPGSVLDAMLLRHAIEEQQVKLFDFLRGDESYKMRLGAHTRRNLEFVIFNLTVRAAVALAIHRAVELVRNARAYRAARQANGEQPQGHTPDRERGDPDLAGCKS
jgi:CelD/BcsL family acetyltransferase involved in cellulose biosynthesis